jgi:hypothetical protein
MTTRDEIAKSVTEVRDFLKGEIARAKQTLRSGKWDTILVGVSDCGELSVHPCRLLLPFHYPVTIDELDAEKPDHFEFAESVLKDANWKPDKSKPNDGEDMKDLKRFFGNHAFASYRKAPRMWSVQRHAVPLFEKLYDKVTAKEGLEFEKVAAQQEKVQRQILQEACAKFDPKQTIIGIESESEEWWEVLTFHIQGPRIPQPPAPVSDVQLLCRLHRQTHNYIGKTAFTSKRGRITEIHLDGACTSDTTIDLLRGIANLKSLCNALKEISLRSTLVTRKSLDFLKAELPHVKVSWSAYPDD